MSNIRSVCVAFLAVAVTLLLAPSPTKSSPKRPAFEVASVQGVGDGRSHIWVTREVKTFKEQGRGGRS